MHPLVSLSDWGHLLCLMLVFTICYFNKFLASLAEEARSRLSLFLEGSTLISMPSYGRKWSCS